MQRLSRFFFLVALVALDVGCTREEAAPPAAPGATPSPPVTTSTPTPSAPPHDWFPEVTKACGLSFVHDSGARGEFHLPEIVPGGVALFDYDGDGDLDLYLVNSGPSPADLSPRTKSGEGNRLFRNDGGRFIDVTGDGPLADHGYGTGVAVGDFDNDGRPDLFVTNYGADRLLRNLGGGKFEDVTGRAGIDIPGFSVSATCFDYDRDGFLDLFVTQYVDYDPERRCFDRAGRRDYCGPLALPPVPDILLHNEGDGTFRDVSKQSGIAAHSAAGLGVTSEDFNDDGWPDIFVANDAYANHLWLNRGDGTFSEEALLLGVAFNLHGHAEAGMGVVVEDFDDDGAFDVFLTHLRQETNTLYRNLGGDRGFSDDTGISQLAASSMELTGFGTASFDLELDGDLDLLVVNGRVMRWDPFPEADVPVPWEDYAEPNLIYRNTGERRFENAHALAPSFADKIEVSRGLATGDLDGDGDIDFVVTNIHGPTRIYRNEAPREGDWILLDVRDPRHRRSAIGARVTLSQGSRSRVRTVRRGSGYVSSHDPRVHFALARGTNPSAVRVEVRWLDGRREAFSVSRTNTVVMIRRGEGKAVP